MIRVLSIPIILVGVIFSIATPVGIIFTIIGLLMWNKSHISNRDFTKASIIGAIITLSLSLLFFVAGQKTDTNTDSQTEIAENGMEDMESEEPSRVMNLEESEELKEEKTKEPEVEIKESDNNEPPPEPETETEPESEPVSPSPEEPDSQESERTETKPDEDNNDLKNTALGAAAGVVARSALSNASELVQEDTADANIKQAETVESTNSKENFDTYDFEERSEGELLVLNKKTKKIHHPKCSSVPKIAPENYEETTLTIAELEAQGYTKCGQPGDWK